MRPVGFPLTSVHTIHKRPETVNFLKRCCSTLFLVCLIRNQYVPAASRPRASFVTIGWLTGPPKRCHSWGNQKLFAF
jgi:hypothetical protein